MKWVIWVLVFTAYLYCFIGIFLLLANITKGLEVDVDVQRVVSGNEVVRTQSVEFNELHSVKWVIGGTGWIFGVLNWVFSMFGLCMAIGVSYMLANYQSRIWGIDDEVKMAKIERLIWISVYVVIFFALSFIFKVRTTDDLFGTTGVLFMAATCAGSYALSAFLCNLPFIKNKTTTAENEVM